MICAQVRAHPAVDFFVVPHWDREHAVGEWGATFQREGKHNLCAFDRALVEMFGSQRAVEAAPLYFLGTFVRRVDSEALGAAFACEAGCGHQVGPELPAYAESPSLDTHRQCLISDIAIFVIIVIVIIINTIIIAIAIVIIIIIIILIIMIVISISININSTIVIILVIIVVVIVLIIITAITIISKWSTNALNDSR